MRGLLSAEVFRPFTGDGQTSNHISHYQVLKLKTL